MRAAATRVRRLSLEELRDSAAAVVLVDVLGASARGGQAGMIWTDYEARIVETLGGSGRAGELVVLSFAGGAAAGREVRIAGVPRLEPGGRYLVFLDDAPAHPVPAIGWGQGLFRVLGNGEEETFVSLDGESLNVDAAGTLVRVAARARVPDRHRLSDPVARNADGTLASLQRPAVMHSTPLRGAHLADIRHFLRASRAR